MRGFEFKTKLNRYYYDDTDGTVTCITKENLNEMIKALSVYRKKIIDSKKNDSFDNEQSDMIDYIKSYSYPTSQLTLIVTEACNFRCKYCIYSGEYSNNRTHSINSMNLDTAKLAIFQYLTHFNEIRKNNIAATPTIGFFGGEPLIKFNLIKESVKYSKSIYKEDIVYTVTTNGSLLNKDIIKFFIKNKFYINITLNGSKEEHDRLRVFVNGEGSFDDVAKGLNTIKEMDPSYFREYVGILTNFDTGTNLLNLERFINSSEYTSKKTILLDKIIDTNTHWYSRYSTEDNQKYFDQLNELKENFISSIRNLMIPTQVPMGLFGPIFKNVLNRNINKNGQEQNTIIKYGGACIPGTKIAVSWDGTLHLCEKVNLDHPIGTVDTWLDIEKIEKLVSEYNNIMSKRCSTCKIQSLCTVCFKDLFGENNNIVMIPKENCKMMFEDYKKTLSLLYSLLEEGIKTEELCEILWGIKP